MIKFLCAKGYSAAIIYREFSLVYAPTEMSGGKIREWCQGFKNGGTNVYDGERSGRPSIQTDEIVEHINRLSISPPADEFLQAGR